MKDMDRLAMKNPSTDFLLLKEDQIPKPTTDKK